MKIGILTLPLHTNYGGILQAFALKTVLVKMGHDVYLIDTDFKKVSPWRAFKKFTKDFLINGAKTKSVKYANKIKFQSYIKYTKPFINKHIPQITKTFYDPKTMGKRIAEFGFDAYIVGSDQIWNPKYFKNIEIAYFSFLDSEKKIRIAYAPSFGVDYWKYNPEKEKICKDLIKKFDAVSVREESGLELCENHLGVKATWVLDPTLLLFPKDYIEILPKENVSKKGNMFTYILDKTDDKRKIINSIADKHNLRPYELDFIESKEPIPLEWGTKSTVEDWIKNFLEAEFIVTDSFHGTVFSILFNKPFYAIINQKRGATRFQSLLNAFDLTDRMLNSYEDLTNINLYKEINWATVNQRLDEKRKISYSFLSQNLNKK